MVKVLEVVHNGDSVVRFDASAGTPALQRRQLDELDFRMDGGIELQGEPVEAPDQRQRMHFVIGLLLRALARDEAVAVSGLCAYLANRVPELAVIHVEARGEDVIIDLEYR